MERIEYRLDLLCGQLETTSNSTEQFLNLGSISFICWRICISILFRWFPVTSQKFTVILRISIHCKERFVYVQHHPKFMFHDFHGYMDVHYRHFYSLADHLQIFSKLSPRNSYVSGFQSRLLKFLFILKTSFSVLKIVEKKKW